MKGNNIDGFFRDFIAVNEIKSAESRDEINYHLLNVCRNNIQPQKPSKYDVNVSNSENVENKRSKVRIGQQHFRQKRSTSPQHLALGYENRTALFLMTFSNVCHSSNKSKLVKIKN